jgi:hypothetical protein
MQNLKKLYDNDLSEMASLLNQLKNRINDYLHINEYINPKIITLIEKDIDRIDKEIEAREEALYK